LGLRSLISTIAAMSSVEGPFGPGFAAVRRGRKEKMVLSMKLLYLSANQTWVFVFGIEP
jgi:hypothetical protein